MILSSGQLEACSRASQAGQGEQPQVYYIV